MHRENANAEIDYVDIEMRKVLRDGAAASHIGLSELTRLPAYVVFIEYSSEIGTGLRRGVGYFGLVSGTEENKIEKVGFHARKSDFVDAPVFDELPLTLECQVVEMEEKRGLICIVGEVLNMSADESILGEDGLVDADKLHALSYDRARRLYRTLGSVVGQAYHDGEQLMK